MMKAKGGDQLTKLLSVMLLASTVLLLLAESSQSQEAEPVPMENFFDDDGLDPNPKKQKPEEKEQAEEQPSAPLPVPEPELPVDKPSPVVAPELLNSEEPQIATELPDDDVEPFMQEEDEKQVEENTGLEGSVESVGEEFTPFDEDPDIQFAEEPKEQKAPEPKSSVEAEIEASEPEAEEELTTDFQDEETEVITELPEPEDEDQGAESNLSLQDDVPEQADEADPNDFRFDNKTRVKTGESIIQHPLAEKGLIRITKDKTYVYRVAKSLQDRAISFRAGIFEPTELANPDTGTTFQESYDQTRGPIAFFEYEWNWLRGSLGKIGLKVGTGVFTTQGNGRFKEEYPANGDRDVPKEQFTFIALPNTASLVYRFQYSDTQMMVPYIDGGLMGITFLEWRDDQDFPKTGIAPAGFFSGGLAFSLSAIDNLAILGLDREYGINNIYFLAEFRQVVNIGSDYDFTAPALNGGFMFEF